MQIPVSVLLGEEPGKEPCALEHTEPPNPAWEVKQGFEVSSDF